MTELRSRFRGWLKVLEERAKHNPMSDRIIMITILIYFALAMIGIIVIFWRGWELNRCVFVADMNQATVVSQEWKGADLLYTLDNGEIITDFQAMAFRNTAESTSIAQSSGNKHVGNRVKYISKKDAAELAVLRTRLRNIRVFDSNDSMDGFVSVRAADLMNVHSELSQMWFALFTPGLAVVAIAFIVMVIAGIAMVFPGSGKIARPQT